MRRLAAAFGKREPFDSAQDKQAPALQMTLNRPWASDSHGSSMGGVQAAVRLAPILSGRAPIHFIGASVQDALIDREAPMTKPRQAAMAGGAVELAQLFGDGSNRPVADHPVIHADNGR